MAARDELTDDEWDRFFEILAGAKEEPSTTVYNLFKAVRSTHFKSLSESSPDLLNALGMELSTYTREKSHDFDYCDVLADKLFVLFGLGNVALQAHILLSLLIMGIDHNRWFVERKFLVLGGAACDERVARRFLIDVEMEGIDLGRNIARWENSINSRRDQLHPIIVNFLVDKYGG